jgi:hypothetical protein
MLCRKASVAKAEPGRCQSEEFGEEALSRIKRRNLACSVVDSSEAVVIWQAKVVTQFVGG